MKCLVLPTSALESRSFIENHRTCVQPCTSDIIILDRNIQSYLEGNDKAETPGNTLLPHTKQKG